MKKLIAVTLGVLGCLVFLKVFSQAGVLARSPKERLELTYALGWSTACVGPGAVYGVILSSANSSGDFLILKDSAPTVNRLGVSDSVAPLGPRIVYSSSTVSGVPASNMNFVFDPPLLFFNGLVAAMSSGNDTATVVFEQGRGLSGQ